MKTSQLTKWNASAEGCGVRADESLSSLKKNNKFFPTYEAHQYVNEGRIWFQKNPIRRWDTSQRELWEILASTLWMVSKQSRMGIWRNNTKWLNLLSGVLPSVLKLQGFQCSFHPNQIRPSSSSYKTCFTGQGFSTGQFHRHWWFVAVEIHGNQNKEYIIAEQRAGNDCKRTFPSTPGSLLLTLSKESFTFQASDFVVGKVTMTVISNQSRIRSGTVTTRYRLEHDDLGRILRSVGIPDEVSAWFIVCKKNQEKTQFSKCIKIRENLFRIFKFFLFSNKYLYTSLYIIKLTCKI